MRVLVVDLPSNAKSRQTTDEATNKAESFSEDARRERSRDGEVSWPYAQGLEGH